MRGLALVAAIIAAVVDILYIGIVGMQPGPPDGLYLRVPFVAGFIALMAIAAALASRQSAERIRPALLALSASGLLAIGYIALFSIGAPLLVAGVLALVAATLSLGRSRWPAGAAMALAGLLVAALLFVGGFDITERAIACPPSGNAGGSGPGFFFSGPYHYSCTNGRLSIVDG